ncbi:hypothetical protein PIB30_057932 [Stylosanthes scabra]|uniref:Uncharacterized protein n=1 Tax=Stylosanthes scabra TaxID=79078 RepID=A0ABU6UKL8_9FABA|nr:hypothetical protein [Stylosanthes scabra]
MAAAQANDPEAAEAIFGGGDEEERYRVELARPGDRQRLLNRCSIAPSQLHPNAWLAIRCFELVTEFLELPQDPKVFLYLFTFFSPNVEGKTRKGYMSVRSGKYRRIFGLFLFYWIFNAGLNYIPMMYKRLNVDQRDTADVLLWLFSKRRLKEKAVLGDYERAKRVIVKTAGHNTTLARLRVIMQSNPQGLRAPSPLASQASSLAPEGRNSTNVGGGPILGWRFLRPSEKRSLFPKSRSLPRLL